MSRLQDLIAKAGDTDPALASELAEEVKALMSRRTFGLVFERHLPESVALPTRTVARGDTVVRDGDDDRLWEVTKVRRRDKVADLAAESKDDDATAESVPLRELTVHVRVGERIYPGLHRTGGVPGDEDAPCHTVITAENSHALRMLGYTHRGRYDVVYLDPPYNTGAKDWKYNNDYVEGADLYRHSKWLAFMERRLKLVRPLLSEDGTLIVTIDEKEYLRLGLLLEQVFPDARIQMVSSVINPNGVERAREFSRVDEYLFFVMLGESGPIRSTDTMLDADTAITASAARRETVRWERLLRGGSNSARSHSPGAVYPVYIDPDTRRIEEVGEVIPPGTASADAPSRPGLTTVVPLGTDGSEKCWRMTPESLRKLVASGHAKVGAYNSKQDRWSLLYLGTAQRRRIAEGQIVVTGRDEHGVVEVEYADAEMGHTRSPKTVWNRASHAAGGAGGSNLLRAMMPDRKFPYPKSLYAVEDAIRFFVADKPDARVLDAFGGSGTTAHAVMRLNAEDGGRRTATLITNNEVGPDEEKRLRAAGHRPGDAEWEVLGIADYITKPRVTAAITGQTPAGDPVKGKYRYNRAADIADGHTDRAEFFTLTYESPAAVRHGLAFERIAPILWLAGGQRGETLTDISAGWAASDHYAVLASLDAAGPFHAAVAERGTPLVFIVTDDTSAFTRICSDLPDGVRAVRLYEDYLTNFTAEIEGD